MARKIAEEIIQDPKTHNWLEVTFRFEQKDGHFYTEIHDKSFKTYLGEREFTGKDFEKLKREIKEAWTEFQNSEMEERKVIVYVFKASGGSKEKSDFGTNSVDTALGFEFDTVWEVTAGEDIFFCQHSYLDPPEGAYPEGFKPSLSSKRTYFGSFSPLKDGEIIAYTPEREEFFNLVKSELGTLIDMIDDFFDQEPNKIESFIDSGQRLLNANNI